MKLRNVTYAFILLPLGAFLYGASFNSPALSAADKINWYTMKEAQELAASDGKKILVYAEASWCTYCNKMEKEVFPKSDVQQVITEFFYPVMADIESDNIITFNDEEMTEQEFANSMRVAATPTFLFIDREGEILGRQPGYMPPDIFKALLTYVGSDAFSRINFDHFYKNEYQKE